MTFTDLQTGDIRGDRAIEAVKTVGDLRDYWANPGAISDPLALLYRTQSFLVEEGEREGLVLWGSTTLMPGRVGDELFMTRGHRHLKPTHGELCVTVSGRGALVLMDGERRTWIEEMTPGSSHWIDGRLAHRTVNTGDEPLVFFCAWPADCGHDYREIEKSGFSGRLLLLDGTVRLVAH